MNDEYYDPCLNCSLYGMCDGWDVIYCCKRCTALGLDDCENCDPMYI